MLLLIGLGNPSAEYENTFHNMGFMAIDTLAAALNKKIKKSECSALTATFSVKGEKVVLAKPLTYMNLSGQSAKSLVAKYRAVLDEIVVIYDDFDLPRYTLRARYEGSAGTHNGMKSVIEELGTTQIKRIRIGIGREDAEAKEFVLSDIKKEDASEFQNTFSHLANLLNTYIKSRDFDELIRDCALYRKKVSQTES
ncbi:MAG: aminoacyl-tRNA hydrolase [Clostridia bacterium]|nr:aminoacyl-tRNA hydrolase [Clostridia bacterium]